MHQFKDGNFGEPFPTEAKSIRESMDLMSRLLEPAIDPRIKATHFGTEEELNKLRWNTEETKTEEM